MKWQELLVEAYQLQSRELVKVLDGLTVEDLRKRPFPGANPIGWLLWHTIRSADRLLGDCLLGEQLWIKDGWHKKFNRPPDFNDTGFGHTDAQVDGLNIPDVKTLMDYNSAVMAEILRRLPKLSEADLEKEYPASWMPGTKAPLHSRLMGELNNLQHVGQAGYVRGVLKGHGWYGR
jgi:hypothetical protein